MKRIVLFVLGSCFALAAQNVQASCGRVGPYTLGIIDWYEYGPDASCWVKSTGPPAATYFTNSCNGEGAFNFPYEGVSTAYYEFVVESTNVFALWNVDARINFDDPNNNSFNQLKITAKVTHNGTPTTTTLFLFNGGSGDLSCYDAQYLSFSAVAGDTVRITIEGRNWFNNTVMQVTVPRVINSNIW